MNKLIYYKKNLVFLTLITILLLMCSNAFASQNFDTDLFNISDTDISKKVFLDIYFPESDMSKSPLSAAIGAFNSVVLLVGGILVAYTIIAGTMSTAHDGDVLGKKWSSMWIPIRFSVGAALLVPSSGGFCAIQMFMLWVVQMSIGAASHVWVSYVENMGVANGVVIPNISNQKIDTLAKQVFLSNLCVLATNDLYKQVNRNVELSSKWISPKSNVEQINKEISKKSNNYIGAYYGYGGYNLTPEFFELPFQYLSFGAEKIEGVSGSVGGYANSIQIDNKNYKVGRDLRACGAYVIQTKSNDLDKKLGDYNNLAPLFNTVLQNQAYFLNKLQSDMSLLARQYYKDTNSVDLQAKIDEAINTYKTNNAFIIEQAFKQTDSWSAYSESIKKDGWMLAGSWSIRLIQIQEILGQLANLTPVTIDPSLSFEQLWPGTELSTLMTKASNDLNASSANSKHRNGLTQQAIAKYEQKDKKDGNAGARALSGIFDDINKEASNTFAFSINPFSNDGNASAHSLVKTLQDSAGSINPLTIAKYYGDLAINLGTLIISISAGVAGVAGIFSGSIVGNALTAAVAFMPISISLWIVGNSLSVLLPLMPYMLWLGMVGGWMILVLEAMVSAPLWVLTQLQPDSDGIAGKGSTGYGLVLSLALRPTLMIIGLICAIEMLNILGGLLSETFSAMLALTGIASGSIIKTIAILFVYFGILYSIVSRSFSLIHIIPDEVMKWLNVNGGQNMSNFAKDSANTTLAKAAMAKVGLDQVAGVGVGVGNKVNALKAKADANKQQQAKQAQAQQKEQAQAQETANRKEDLDMLENAYAETLNNNDFDSIAQQANSKLELSKVASKAGDNAKAHAYMQQAKDLGKQLTPEQARESGLNETLIDYSKRNKK